MIATTRRGEKARDSLRTRWAGVLLAALAALGTAAAYLIWLGWHASKDIHPDGSQTGPYEEWQVVGLVLTIAIITVGLGLSGHYVASFAIPPTLTILWSWDAATLPDSGPSFWPIGAFLIGVGSIATVPVAASVVAAIASRPALASRSQGDDPDRDLQS